MGLSSETPTFFLVPRLCRGIKPGASGSCTPEAEPPGGVPSETLGTSHTTGSATWVSIQPLKS